MPQISVIIPVYNTEEYLKQCIDSVLNQEEIDVELILLDDGSTDKSVYICQKYSEKYENIHFFKGKHGGVSDARNCGIKRAKGDYIMFLDSDDFLQPNVLKKMYDAVSLTYADMVVGNYCYQYGKKQKPAEPRLVDNLYTPLQFIHHTCVGGNKLYSASLLKSYKIRFPKLSLGEDLVFFHTYLSYCIRIVTIPDDIYTYRMREGSISKSYGLKALDYLKAFHLIEEVYREYPAMLKELSFDEMFYIRANIKRLPRYENKADRKCIFNNYQYFVHRHNKGTEAAMKLRRQILHMHKWIYCGSVSTGIYKFLRKCKHALRGDL